MSRTCLLLITILFLPAASSAVELADPACPARNWDAARRQAWIAEADARPGAAVELLACLEEADPRVRDEHALGTLTGWLRSGRIDVATRRTLGERLVLMLEGPADAAGFRHPFAAMALAEVARAERLDPRLDARERAALVEVAAAYLTGIGDYRAWDARAGWRHAVAHGADLVLQLGLHPKLDAEAQRRLLAALATKIAPADAPAYVAGEPERLARAVHYLHARGLLAPGEQLAWLKQLVETAPADSETAAYLSWRHNLLAFLQALGYAARASDQAERAHQIDEIAEPLLGV